MALVFNIFLGLTLSTTDYSKALNLSYESLKVESYGMDISLKLADKYYLELDFKRLAAQVQSGSGLLNIYGWDYTHDIAMIKFGHKINATTSFYASPVLYYVPILFPTQVGALTSIAAFEKTPAYGLGLGCKYELQQKKIKIKFDASLSYLEFASDEFSTNYSYVFDLDIHPTYALNKSMELGLNYNLVNGFSSFIENKTGSDFPIKTSNFLHNLFLTFAYTLQ